MLGEGANPLVIANTKGAGTIPANITGYLDGLSTYKGNDKDVVDIIGSNLNGEQTWPNIDVSYRITSNVTIKAHLTIEAGAALVFQQNTQLKVDTEGALTAEGTSDKPVLFTGEEKTAGYWHGLYFGTSNDQNNKLSYVTVEYGGGGGNANIRTYASQSSHTQIKVTQSIIRHSSNYGIWFSKYTDYNSDIETSNTFSNNENGNIVIQN